MDDNTGRQWTNAVLGFFLREFITLYTRRTDTLPIVIKGINYPMEMPPLMDIFLFVLIAGSTLNASKRHCCSRQNNEPAATTARRPVHT